MNDRALMRTFHVAAALAMVLSGCGSSEHAFSPPSTPTPIFTSTFTSMPTVTSTPSHAPTPPPTPTPTETAVPTHTPPHSLTVMTLNVLCSFCDLKNYDPWDQRLAYFGDIFARHDPDLIGLQELSPPPFNRGMEVAQILAHAPGREAIYYAPHTGSPYPDATILYRSSRFTVLEHGEYWLSPTPDTPLSTGFASPQLPRLVVWARLRDTLRNRELYFATTHFDNNSPSQALSAPLVQERTAPFVETEPVILVGDFNSRPDSTAYQILTTDSSKGFVFQNAFDLTQWHIVTNQTPEPAYDVNDRIDHIFLAGHGVSWSASSWVADLTVYGPQQRYPSDHFPIIALVDY